MPILHEDHVVSLLKKASAATKPDDAMKFAQAATNAANALATLAHTARENAKCPS